MTLAKRIRDCRYAKGWGPDELAGRAEISRTALYQIECGKTETPRAGTLRRIARALDVSIDVLLGNEHWDVEAVAPAPAAEPKRETHAVESHTEEARDRDLSRKFQEVLASPLGAGLARIIEESHRLIPSVSSRY